MDDQELLYRNQFVSDLNVHGGYGLTEELRKEKLKDFVTQELPEAPRDDKIVENDILKTNRVMTDDGKAKDLEQGIIVKEKRTVLNINSNQRNFLTDSELTDPSEFFNYILKDNYQEFSELYQLANNLGSTMNIQTYQEYAAENNIEIPVIGNFESRCREIVRNIVSDRTVEKRTQQRSVSVLQKDGIDSINSSLINLLTSVAVTITGRSDFESMANRLNAFAMSGAAYNPNNFWRPFYFTGNTGDNDIKIKKIVYNEQFPSKYKVTLPSIIKHVKSISLLGTEIPNTINNITERNNIIVLQIRRKGDIPVPLELKTDKNIFSFILVKLEVGNYSIESLLEHLEQKLNTTCRELLVKQHGDLFDVSWKPSNGQVTIECRRKELEFHLKFYSQLTDVSDVPNPGVIGESLGKTSGVITNYSHDLWYILGFPWPYEVDQNGGDKYTSILTNVVNFGIHEIFSPDHLNNDIFDRKDYDNSIALKEIYDDTLYLSDSKHDVINTYRAYRYPQMPGTYIYLVLKGLKSMQHINQFNGVTSFKDNDFFAKIQLNVKTGEVAYNSFISSPLIFLNAIDKLEELYIEWVDERGELVDFNKVDHSFTLEVIHYITQLEVNDYDTGLGTIDKRSYPLYLSRK
jgi:hypothetical protein